MCRQDQEVKGKVDKMKFHEISGWEKGRGIRRGCWPKGDVLYHCGGEWMLVDDNCNGFIWEKFGSLFRHDDWEAYGPDEALKAQEPKKSKKILKFYPALCCNDLGQMVMSATLYCSLEEAQLDCDSAIRLLTEYPPVEVEADKHWRYRELGQGCL